MNIQRTELLRVEYNPGETRDARALVPAHEGWQVDGYSGTAQEKMVLFASRPISPAKPTGEYTSVLFCFHSGHTDVFVNGRPAGVLRHTDGRTEGIVTEGFFEVHTTKNLDGSPRVRRFDELGAAKPAFCTCDDLRRALENTARAIDVPS